MVFLASEDDVDLGLVLAIEGDGLGDFLAARRSELIHDGLEAAQFAVGLDDMIQADTMACRVDVSVGVALEEIR